MKVVVQFILSQMRPSVVSDSNFYASAAESAALSLVMTPWASGKVKGVEEQGIVSRLFPALPSSFLLRF